MPTNVRFSTKKIKIRQRYDQGIQGGRCHRRAYDLLRPVDRGAFHAQQRYEEQRCPILAARQGIYHGRCRTGENQGPGIPGKYREVNDDYKEKNIAAQSKDPTSLLSLYRELIHLRADHPALQVGEYSPVESGDNDLLAFLRESQEEIVLVIINLNKNIARDNELTIEEGSLAGTYRAFPLYGSAAELPDLTANEKGGFDDYRPLPEIPGEGMVVIQLQPSE